MKELVADNLEQRVDSQQVQAEMLVQIAIKNEILRKEFSEQLLERGSEVERLVNQHLNDLQKNQLQSHVCDFIQEKLKVIHTSFDHISVDHKFGEDLKQKIVELTKVNVQLKEQVSDFMRLIATTQQERDTFRDETKDLTEQKNKLIAQNTILTSSYKEKCMRLD